MNSPSKAYGGSDFMKNICIGEGINITSYLVPVLDFFSAGVDVVFYYGL